MQALNLRQSAVSNLLDDAVQVDLQYCMQDLTLVDIVVTPGNRYDSREPVPEAGESNRYTGLVECKQYAVGHP